MYCQITHTGAVGTGFKLVYIYIYKHISSGFLDEWNLFFLDLVNEGLQWKPANANGVMSL
jgi:hypothetical protein